MRCVDRVAPRHVAPPRSAPGRDRAKPEPIRRGASGGEKKTSASPSATSRSRVCSRSASAASSSRCSVKSSSLSVSRGYDAARVCAPRAPRSASASSSAAQQTPGASGVSAPGSRATPACDPGDLEGDRAGVVGVEQHAGRASTRPLAAGVAAAVGDRALARGQHRVDQVPLDAPAGGRRRRPSGCRPAVCSARSRPRPASSSCQPTSRTMFSLVMPLQREGAREHPHAGLAQVRPDVGAPWSAGGASSPAGRRGRCRRPGRRRPARWRPAR